MFAALLVFLPVHAAAQTGSITGTVTDADTGTPLANVTVEVHDASGAPLGGTTTNASGIYAKSGLPPGVYYVRTSNTLGYADELYYERSCPDGTCTITNGRQILVTSASATGGIDFSLAPGGSITGVVTDAATGAPLANVKVALHDAANTQLGYAWTDASGVYTTGRLAPGTYYLRTMFTRGYLDELYDNLPCLGYCSPYRAGAGVTVTAGSVTSGIGFALTAGGTITGTVTDAATHAPLAGVDVNIYNTLGSTVGSAKTDASGAYVTSGLVAGTYYVRTLNTLGYIDELYGDLSCPGNACSVTTGTGVPVGAGAATSGIDIGLNAGGTITGTVTASATGAPLAFVTVYVYNSAGSTAATVMTDAAGVYTATGLGTGTHYVRTRNTLGYIDQLYSGTPCVYGCSPYTNGTGVGVTAGAVTNSINFSLTVGGAITGTVTDAATSAALTNVTVYLYNASGSYQGSVYTNASGAYRAAGLVSGTYYAETYNSLGYIDELYDGTACPNGSCTVTNGNAVQVTAGSDTGGINFSLAVGGTVSGTVTNEATGAPLAFVTVYVYNASGGSVGGVTTDASGVYAGTGLPTGTYYLRTSNTLGYIDELYSGTPCVSSCSPYTSGTGVSVTAGNVTGGINFGLAAGGRITGTVTDAATGALLPNVSVYVYNASGKFQGSTTTNESGAYTRTGLLTGTHYVRTSNSLGYIDELYDNLPCPSGSCTYTSGTGVAVTAGATTGGINFALAMGGSITGTVTDAATGAPLANVQVGVYNASGTYQGSAITNASGVYTKSALQTGTHYVRTSNSLGYVDEQYNNQACVYGNCMVTSGTGVAVTAGATTGGINFGLVQGGTITGTVTTAATGAPLANVSVYVQLPSGASVGSAQTGGSGTYTVSGLPTGPYYVRTSNSLGYLDELYNDQPCVGSCSLGVPGTSVAVTAGATTSGIDFGLSLGGTITGTVTSAASAAPLSGVSVLIYNASGVSQGTVTTNASGVYTRSSLAPGTYYVRTSNSLGYVDELYNDLSCPGGSCTVTTGVAVGVATGTVTSGINFGLSPGGTITGTVTDALTGAPLSSVTVSIYNASGVSQGSATTDASGVYTRNGLAAGTYYVRTSNSAGYLDELYNDLPCPSGSCTVTTGAGVAVTSGTATPGVNFGLVKAATITGKVTDAGTGAPLANVSVYVVDLASGSYVSYPSTNASGVYTTSAVPAGAYAVFTYNALGYLNEVYDNRICGSYCSTSYGTPVAVTKGTPATGVDFSLQKIRSADNDLCSAPAVVASASFSDAVSTAAATTSADDPSPGCGADSKGNSVWYRFTAPAQGIVVADTIGSSYNTVLSVHTGSCGSLSSVACSDDTSSQQSQVTLGVAAGQTYYFMVSTRAAYPAGNLVFRLAFTPGGTGGIAGTVTAAATGTPLAGVSVDLYDLNGLLQRSAVTNASGVYTATTLPPGTYYLRTTNSLGYLNEVYNNLPCGVGCNAKSGTGVAVSADTTTSGIDFSLSQAGAVTGTVTSAATGLPIANVSVYVCNSAGVSQDSVLTNASGVYTKPGLAPGTYYVRTGNAQGYFDQLHSGLPCIGGVCTVTTGTPVTVADGAATGGINFALPSSAAIGGTVTDAATGAPLDGVYVQVYTDTGNYQGSVRTHASGAFLKAGMVTGTYYVRFSDYGLGYIDELYDNISCPGHNCPAVLTGAPVTITNGSTTVVNAGLVFGGSVTGTVTSSATGLPLSGVQVYVYDANGVSQGVVSTNASGAWVRSGLTTGTYYVKTTNNLGYIDEVYNDLPCAGSACPALTSGAAVSVTLGATTSGINFALAPGGTLTGKVRSASTNTVLIGIPVLVYDSLGRAVASVSTNGFGEYTKTGLKTGTYYLRTSNALGYADELYNDIPCPDGGCAVTSGTGVPVTAGATTSGIDFGLAAGGSITGTVSSSSTGALLSNVVVSIYTAEGRFVGSATTNASGVYTKSRLATGTYYLRTSSSPGYTGELYNDVPCPNGACTVTAGEGVAVTAGATTGGINFALTAGGTISGVLRHASTGAALSGISVTAYSANGIPAAAAVTNSSGAYSIGGLPASTYYVLTANTFGYIDELYNDQPCPGGFCSVTTGTGVAVAAGTTRSGVDFTLSTGGAVTGTVVAESGGPISGATVRVYNAAGGLVGSALTNAAGAYTVTGLLTGTHFVRTSNPYGFIDELYDNLVCAGEACTATAGVGVNVTAATAAAGIDFVLAAGGSIAGTVTGGGPASPLSGVTVRAFTAGGALLASATTNASGVYQLVGLPAGTVYVWTSNGRGYIDELYDGLSCPGESCAVTSGTGVSVAVGALTTGIDFDLARGGTITGTITDAATGLPVSGVTVSVIAADGRPAGSATTNASGVFTAEGLASGAYHLKTQNSQGYLDEAWDNVPCWYSACAATAGVAVAVTAGSTTSGINYALTPGGVLTGAVKEAGTSRPLAFVYLYVHDAEGAYRAGGTTDSSGVFTVRGLPTGTYHLVTSNTLGYVDEAYLNLPCPALTCSITGGVGIGVAAGVTTGGINFELAAAGSIAGTVRDTGTGAPLTGVTVSVYASDGTMVGSVRTDMAGLYFVPGLPAGAYFVRTVNQVGYVDELYNNVACIGGACAPTSGTPVNVTSGATAAGIDFGLSPGGAVAGAVMAASTAAPLVNVPVTVHNAEGASLKTVLTNGLGQYTASGLPAGTYYVRTVATQSYVNEIYAGVPCPSCGTTTSSSIAVPGGATGVSVAAGATTNGIGFSLTAGGTITGSVTAAGTAAPLAGVAVAIYDASGVRVGSATTNPAGVYTTPGLASGLYFLETMNGLGYVDELYNGVPCAGGACPPTSGTGVSVTAGGTTPGISFSLSTGGMITGAVTDARTGAPLANLPVTIHNALGAALKSGVTDGAGQYRVSGLATGVYYMRTVATAPYVNELYDGVPCPSCSTTTSSSISVPFGAAGVAVTAGATTSGINVALGPAGGEGGVWRDFNGDGKGDVLWWHESLGQVWLWPMNGPAHMAEVYVSTVPDTTWEIRAVADFDGNGTPDLMWRNKSSGQIYFWPMQGSLPQGEIYVGTIDPAYDIVGSGDFNADGKADLLWRHQTAGDVWVWLMDGALSLEEAFIGRVDPAYVVKGVGDFDGDGKADILWHHATLGEVWLWPMDGTSRLSETWVATVPDVGYQVQAVADFNGDLKADILWWHQASGEVWLWLMDGPARLTESWVATVPDTQYRIATTGDYDGDGKTDILWHHATRGEVWAWMMNGSARLSETWVATVPDTGYRIVK